MTEAGGDREATETNSDTGYFVVGGRYADTTFRELLAADPVAGPFASYPEAVEAWRASSMAHVDEAFVRYLVVEADDAEAAMGRAVEPPDAPEARSA